MIDAIKFGNALGESRMKKIASVEFHRSGLEIVLVNGWCDGWDFGDFTDSEIIADAKRVIDEIKEAA